MTPRLLDQRPISVLRVSELLYLQRAYLHGAKRRAHAPVRNYLIAKLCRHTALAIGLISVFDRLVEWTTNFLLAAENLHKVRIAIGHQYGERSDASGSRELSFGISPRSNTKGNTASRNLVSDRKD